MCNILTFDPAVNQETGASSRRYQSITLSWIRCNCSAHKKQVDDKQLYNRVPQTAWVSWSSSCSSRQWEPAPSRGLGPSGPPVEQPSRMWKEALLWPEELGGQYVAICSVYNSPLTHYTYSCIMAIQHMYLVRMYLYILAYKKIGFRA